MITFRLDIIPPKATSQTKRLVTIGGKPRFFPKKEHQQAEHTLVSLCAQHQPARPLAGPVRLAVGFVFPWRKSEPKKHRASGIRPMNTRPDCDNLVKLVADVLTRLRFYQDDGQVADLRVTKAWGDHPGIEIRIEEIRFEEMAPRPGEQRTLF
jgi:Holliday junction resolvase RusA-like endonuclease